MRSEVMALVVHFLTLLLAVGVCLGDDNWCPPPEDIIPCTCGKGTIGVEASVVCNRVDDVEEVRRALQSLKGIRRVSVQFRNCSLGLVPSDLFHGLWNIAQVDFHDCDLQGIGNEGRQALEGLEETLKSLTVENSLTGGNETGGNETSFPRVAKLHALEYLFVQDNNIKELANEVLTKYMYNLKYVSVEGNGIERLGDRAFEHVTQLEVLWLGSNRVRNLKRSMLPYPALHLSYLDITNAEISSLPYDIFTGMPALKSVYLHDNYLKRIPITTWLPVWSGLSLLDLHNNPLLCDSYIEWTFQRPRPRILWGACASPDEKKGLLLGKLIDSNNKEI